MCALRLRLFAGGSNAWRDDIGSVSQPHRERDAADTNPSTPFGPVVESPLMEPSPCPIKIAPSSRCERQPLNVMRCVWTSSAHDAARDAGDYLQAVT